MCNACFLASVPFDEHNDVGQVGSGGIQVIRFANFKR